MGTRSRGQRQDGGVPVDLRLPRRDFDAAVGEGARDAVGGRRAHRLRRSCCGQGGSCRWLVGLPALPGGRVGRFVRPPPTDRLREGYFYGQNLSAAARTVARKLGTDAPLTATFVYRVATSTSGAGRQGRPLDASLHAHPRWRFGSVTPDDESVASVSEVTATALAPVMSC